MLYIIYIFLTAFLFLSSSVNYFLPEFDKYLILVFRFDIAEKKNYKTFILF